MSLAPKTEGQGTIVGAGVKLTGALRDHNDIMVFGRVEGEVASESNVFVGETAFIKGPISAKAITVSGKILGSVEGKEKIEIDPTGFINGSITTKELIVKSGATFIGKSTMPDKNKGVEDVDLSERKEPAESTETKEK